MTTDVYSLNLLAKLMVLHRQILFSLAVAVIAEANLMRISAEQVPSLHRVDPKAVSYTHLTLPTTAEV